MASFLILLLLPAVMWLLLIRPQQQRVRAAQALVASLEIGDEVVTAGGIFGVITDADDTTLWVEIAPDVVVRVLRAAITRRVTDDDDEVEDDEDADEALEPGTVDSTLRDDES